MTSSTPTSTPLPLSDVAAPLGPSYDRSQLTTGIVHFGVGGFHRSHQAMYLDRLMRDGRAMDWAITGVGVLPGDRRMRDVLRAQDGLYTLVLKHPDGHVEPRVIGSIRDVLWAPEDPGAVLDLLAAPATRIVSLTVTEGGYTIDDATGAFREDAPGAVHDAADPAHPITTFGYLVEALRRRRDAGVAPFTVMSCDNLPGNGRVARTAVVAQGRMTDPELGEWIDREVAFPNSMVDRITPVTTPEDVARVRDDLGIDDAWPVVAEPFAQWVLQDAFTMGRPPLEEAGVQVVPDVAPYELMKLRLLNASHQSLAHWGRLLSCEYADRAASDPDIAAFTRAYLDREAVPTLLPVPGIDVPDYIETLFQRFANAAIADTEARLAQDASDRMPKFVLPSVRDNLAAGRSVRLGAAMCAAWALGMEGIDEGGAPIVVDDKAWGRIEPEIAAQKAGDAGAFLADEPVFGEIGRDPRFRESFVRALGELRARGARAVLRELAAGTPL